MSKRCRKCGGSGDMFVMEKGLISAVVAFRYMDTYKMNGYKATGSTVCCSVCNGLGVEDAR